MAASYREISGPNGHLAHLRPFDGNSLTGLKGWHNPYGSRLPSEHRPTDTGAVIYTVLSYATPVGWVLADGTVVVPDVRYSVTTSKGQGYVRAWLAHSRQTAAA